MGLKVRAAVAMAGMVLSWGFGLDFLSGVAHSVDSFGNIMVDIADGIGLVSKAIEAVEGFIDPPPAGTFPSEPVDEGSGSSKETLQVIEEPPKVPSMGGDVGLPTQTPVICRKGKCHKYDPAKDKFLQQKLIQQERERILRERLDLAGINTKQLRGLDEEELEELFKDKLLTSKLARNLASGRGSVKRAPPLEDDESAEETSGEIQFGKGRYRPAPPKPVLLGGAEAMDPTGAPPERNSTSKGSTWRFGTKRLLSKMADLLGRVNSLMLKTVRFVFPWNQRARSRLSGNKEEEDGG